MPYETMVGAVVPTKDESETVGGLVTDLLKFCDSVVVADDSDDDTAKRAQSVGALVVRASGGLDEAYWFGMQALPQDWWTLTIDAGGSHDPWEARSLVDHATADVTIGSRFCYGADYLGRPNRRRLSKVAARMMNVATGWDIKDWTSGLRVYSPKARAILAEHQFRTKGHAWQIESLWALKSAGLSVVEVPITYTAGRSHMDAERAREALGLWARIALS